MIQILVNLLSNALKFTPERGEVQVEGSEESDHVLIQVHDTGTGIPQEDLPYVFERFYRADKSRNRRTGGGGLGLTIVKELVAAHGGDISAESGPQGTTFTIHLPKDPLFLYLAVKKNCGELLDNCNIKPAVCSN